MNAWGGLNANKNIPGKTDSVLNCTLNDTLVSQEEPWTANAKNTCGF